MELKELKETFEKHAKTWHDFQGIHKKYQAEVEKNGFVSSLTNIALTKANDEMDRLEKKMSKMQAQLDRPARGDGKDDMPEEQRKHNDLINNYCRKGKEGMTPEEVKGLSVTVSDLGGFLVPEQRENELIKSITEISPIRQIARVRQTSTDSLKIPKRTDQFAAIYINELGARAETEGYKVGLEDIPVHELHAMVPITHQLIEDSGPMIESEINDEIRTQFAKTSGNKFVLGTGVGTPEGFVTNAQLQTDAFPNGHATVLDPDSLIGMFYDVKDGYINNSNWVMKRASIGTIRLFTDAVNGQYLWQPGLSAGQSSLLLGRPVIEAVDMPTIEADAFPIAFGDFRQGYSIVDRIGIAILRIEDSTTLDEGGIRVYGRARNGGQVVNTEAIRLLKMVT